MFQIVFTKLAQQSDEKGNAFNTFVKHQGYKCVLGLKLNVNRNVVYIKIHPHTVVMLALA